MPVYKSSRYKSGRMYNISDGTNVKHIVLDRKLAAFDNRVDYKFYTVVAGDTLDAISKKFYNNEGYWWVIADFNDIINPFDDLKPGMRILIPNFSSVLL